ncbi:MAG TPA: isopentenyl-diphosphate Delta-isomerase [Ohtaekwangia sp.]|nr:isopentenyl-diphosphate Delta-isomerase [Ohtaekwangia sp.]
MEKVILVNPDDQEVGTMEKMEAHRQGLLHRAFSILLFNTRGEILLQKRSAAKYHSAGLWTNTCCSHPLPGESPGHAARRKLKQEMGIDLQPDFAYKFLYIAPLENGLTEHELDYVFVGRFDGEPAVNAEEVSDWKYVDLAALRKDIEQHPARYTVWFKMILDHNELASYVMTNP